MECPVCQSEKRCGHKTIGVIIIVLAIIIGGYFLLQGGYRAPAPAVIPTATPEKQTEQPTTPTAEVPVELKEINVTGSEFRFNPSSISLQSDEKVKITFINNGKSSHNLIVEDLGIGTKTIGGGQSDTIEFTTPASGTYTFFCSIPGHRARGMEGSLKVE